MINFKLGFGSFQRSKIYESVFGEFEISLLIRHASRLLDIPKKYDLFMRFIRGGRRS